MNCKRISMTPSTWLACCALPACLMFVPGCGKPYVILNPQEGGYHVRIEEKGSAAGEIVEKDIAQNPSGTTVEVPLKKDGLHRVEVKNAAGRLIADFDLNLYGGGSTRFNFSNKEIKIETLPNKFTPTTMMTLLYGIGGVAVLAIGGAALDSVESAVAKDGTCAEEPIPPATQCRLIFRIQDTGTLRAVNGLIVGVGGVFVGLAIFTSVFELKAHAKKSWRPIMRITNGALNP